MPQRRSRPRAKLAALGALVLASAACNKAPELVGGNEPSGPLRTDNRIAATGLNSVAAADAGEAGELPAPGAGPRFVGKWAADQKSCVSATWVFTASALRVPDGESCSFDQVSQVAGGYEIQATCTAKGAASADSLHIRFAESAKAMLLKSKALGDKGLVFCGRDA